MAYDLHVVRTASWLDAGSDPISRADVDTAIAADPDLAWSASDYVDMADDSGATTRYFMITWRGQPVFWWYRDQVILSGPEEDQIVKLIALATTLNAIVVGDDGERYALGSAGELTITPA